MEWGKGLRASSKRIALREKNAGNGLQGPQTCGKNFKLIFAWLSSILPAVCFKDHIVQKWALVCKGGIHKKGFTKHRMS